MYVELYQYLVQHKELPVPGIGTFLLERRPAVVDFPNKIINPPSYSFALQPGSYVPGQRFFNWLGNSLGITDREAVFRFNDFAFDLKKQISDGAVIEWEGVGTLNKSLNGDVKFVPAEADIIHERPVPAEKVIRQKAEHMVRVGEDEKTSEEMTEMLGRKEEKKSYWWTFALALAILSFIFIGWHFSKHGLDLAATANASKLIPGEAGETYLLK
jgi:hypothetical protein